MVVRAAIVLLLTAWAAVAGPNEELDSLLTPETAAKLEKGDVVVFKKGSKDTEGGSRAYGRVLALIDRPKKDVWYVLTHNEEHPKYAPHLVSVERYYEEGNKVGIKETVRLLFKTYRYHCIQTRDEDTGTITWELDKTKENSIRDTTGSWFIRPYGGDKTLVMYTVSIDSGLFFPQAAENFLFNHDLPNIVVSLKKYVESMPPRGNGAGEQK